LVATPTPGPPRFLRRPTVDDRFRCLLALPRDGETLSRVIPDVGSAVVKRRSTTPDFGPVRGVYTEMCGAVRYVDLGNGETPGPGECHADGKLDQNILRQQRGQAVVCLREAGLPLDRCAISRDGPVRITWLLRPGKLEVACKGSRSTRAVSGPRIDLKGG
jgi:hypothetical protein